MSSKNLSGYLLAVSPILMIVMFAVVFPAVIGTGEDMWDTSKNVSSAAKPYFTVKDKTKSKTESY